MSDTPEMELALSRSRDLRFLNPMWTGSSRKEQYTLPTKFVAGRKEHVCTWCGKNIAKGELHHFWLSVGTSRTSNRMHHECLAAAIYQDKFEYAPFKNKRPNKSAGEQQ